ncbi:hypothetical protein QF037_009790 [Streptomyces canus]|nr:hypothetical protein [Streptomyces canus]
MRCSATTGSDTTGQPRRPVASGAPGATVRQSTLPAKGSHRQATVEGRHQQRQRRMPHPVLRARRRYVRRPGRARHRAGRARAAGPRGRRGRGDGAPRAARQLRPEGARARAAVHQLRRVRRHVHHAPTLRVEAGDPRPLRRGSVLPTVLVMSHRPPEPFGTLVARAPHGRRPAPPGGAPRPFRRTARPCASSCRSARWTSKVDQLIEWRDAGGSETSRTAPPSITRNWASRTGTPSCGSTTPTASGFGATSPSRPRTAGYAVRY